MKQRFWILSDSLQGNFALVSRLLSGMWLISITILSAPTALTAEVPEKFSVYPKKLRLNAQDKGSRFVVQRVDRGRVGEQFKNEFEVRSNNTNVVEVQNGRVVPRSPGTANILVSLGDEQSIIRVQVDSTENSPSISFRNQVQPILARFGCNSGACHGAAAGQNGFRLSLRGYDDEGDFLALTRHAFGRRVSLVEPERSLVLLKATGAVPHKGGIKFGIESEEYSILSRWISQGAPKPSATEARIVSISVYPPQISVGPGKEQKFLVLAHFSDGRDEDVTSWTKFSSSNESVLVVDDQGKASTVGAGEGAITAWYLSKLATAFVSVPFSPSTSESAPTELVSRNFIDDLVAAKLRDLGLPASPRCSDSDFIRRLFLDLCGILPTAEESKKFLEDKSLDKRDRLVEHLLGRPEYVDYWTYKWSDLLLVQSKTLRTSAMWAFYHWIREQVESNTPWDEFTRRILTARGSTLGNGAANFYVLHNEPKLAAENVSQAFLGMSINCARCHNHPMERWTNDEYYGFANLFARVRTKSTGVEGDNVVFVSHEGDLAQPLRGRPQPPKPLEGDAMQIGDPSDRRLRLADWVVSPSNPYFSKAIVNRVWANFFGVGLVDKVDDLRASNPPTNAQLFDALAEHLAKNRFDLKELIRTMVKSETYQRSSEPLPSNKGDTRFYSRYYPRRMHAEVLLDAISAVTGVPTKLGNYPDGWRALQLPDSNVDSYFLKSFGRADRDRTCECERSGDPSVAQVLHLSNGNIVNQKLSNHNGVISKDVARKASFDELIDLAYLRAYSRFPNAEEKLKLTSSLRESASSEVVKREALEDLYWALLTSKEFLFHH